MDRELVAQYLQAVEAGLDVTELERQLDAPLLQAQARLADVSALGNAAHWYADQGIPVFPLQPGSKIPWPQSHGFEDGTLSHDVIHRWWTACPPANIGAATGRVFDVVDIDGYEGHKALADANAILPPELGCAITRRPGGRHVFIAPTGSGNRAGFLDHVDYRGKGGYVVMAPSVVEGRRYTWLHPLVLS